MAKLTSKARKALPAKSFAGPGRSFPINDDIHAEKALQMAPRSVKAGNITPMQAAMIKQKARAKLGTKEPTAKKIAKASRSVY